MNNYKFPESVLSPVFTACFRYAALMPVETPIEMTRDLLEVMESFIDRPVPLYSTGQSMVMHISRLTEARAQLSGDPEGCGADPDLDFQIKIAIVIHKAWCDWWSEQNMLAMGYGPDDAWDRCDPMFRETQCKGKMEVPEDDTLTLEDKADFEDTPF